MAPPDPTADFFEEDEPVARIVEVFELGEKLTTRLPTPRSDPFDPRGESPLVSRLE